MTINSSSQNTLINLNNTKNTNTLSTKNEVENTKEGNEEITEEMKALKDKYP